MPSPILREKPRQRGRIVGLVLAIAVAAAIFYASSIPGGDLPSHPNVFNVVAHFLEYALLAGLLAVALNSPDRKLWQTLIIAVVIASLYGASDEVHQHFVPGRTPDILDWLTDTIGAFVGASLAVWLIAARRVRQSRRRDL